MNEHVKIIQDLVFHSLPYNRMILNPNTPHSEDCEGCRINAEVKKLVRELDALSPVRAIVAELKEEKEGRRVLALDRERAFAMAGLPGQSGGRTVADLVAELMNDRDRLTSKLDRIKGDVNSIAEKLNEE
jgi:hypothetical protein